MKLYEAMFLVDSNKARQDDAKVIEELGAVIQKGGGQVVNCNKWEERKLAYPIGRRRRGTYYLAHFRAEGEAIGKIERAARLDETVLRVLIVCDEDGEAFPVFAVEPEEEGFGGRFEHGGHGGHGGRDGREGRGEWRGPRERERPAAQPEAPAAGEAGS